MANTMVHILKSTAPTGGRGPKGGVKQNFELWLAICQNVTKFDGEHDGAYLRTNWMTNPTTNPN